MKKFLLLILWLSNICVYAVNESSAPVAVKKRTYTPQNNPLAGSHQQSSEQQFGAPAVKGTPGEKYNVTDGGKAQNNPLAGSHQQSSEQQFGMPAVSGTTGVRPKSNLTPATANNPTVGGRQSSSDQIFGNPGDPTND